ncbi:carboxypeptidase M32 [Bacillus sp. D386]|uniref:carboxypeptidase M32 n=1 Tax=Bacillus sp. D386 TaxID=2587155 RepID=UPI0011247578|nr:carboxypeptidase M32 [Bacillus sp. D386]
MTNLLEKEFLDYIHTMDAFREASALIGWDMRTGAPKKTIDKRSQVLSILSKEHFEMATGTKMERYIEELSKPELKEQLDSNTIAIVEECKKEYEKMSKIPANEYKEYVELQSKAESIWETAKETSDFSLFMPYLEQLIDVNKNFLSYWGKADHPYDGLLDLYEQGMTVEILDDVFARLREEIVPLVKKIGESNKNLETNFIYKSFSEDAQKKLCMELIQELGYDLEAGRLDNTVHPFATALNANDVRITTKYVEEDFRVALFGTIHECGHAVYEQNINKELEGTPLCTGTSMGIHESQSLFFENFISRNLSYWKHNFDKLKAVSPEQFDNIDLDTFYKAINESKPSLIRIEADELTYPLHIMIRYELEKGLFNGDLKVADLPKHWNDKYEEYLGIRPENDGEGVLQDVHWAGGMFGYFPSYALGYMYAAQFKAAMLKDIPNFDETIENGDYNKITGWLTKHVHQYGKLKLPLEIIKDATGEGLNPQYLITYLKEKYTALYDL